MCVCVYVCVCVCVCVYVCVLCCVCVLCVCCVVCVCVCCVCCVVNTTVSRDSELYNHSGDPFQENNLWPSTAQSTKNGLLFLLSQLVQCAGQACVVQEMKPADSPVYGAFIGSVLVLLALCILCGVGMAFVDGVWAQWQK